MFLPYVCKYLCFMCKLGLGNMKEVLIWMNIFPLSVFIKTRTEESDWCPVQWTAKWCSQLWNSWKSCCCHIDIISATSDKTYTTVVNIWAESINMYFFLNFFCDSSCQMQYGNTFLMKRNPMFNKIAPLSGKAEVQRRSWCQHTEGCAFPEISIISGENYSFSLEVEWNQ